MIYCRTYLSPSYIDDFLRDPLVATVKWNLGWRPKEPLDALSRMAFGRLRERAELLFRRGWEVGTVTSAIIDDTDYRLLCDSAPPTRFAMQPQALLDAIRAFGRTAPDRFSGEVVEEYQPRTETPIPETDRVLVCKGDLWVRETDGARVWVELKATSSNRGVEMIEAYRQSVQGRLYALVADGYGMPVRYNVWDVGPDRTAFRPFEFHEDTELLEETRSALFWFARLLDRWESQAGLWTPSWEDGDEPPTCYAPVLPSPGRKGHWRNLFALPAGPARYAYLVENFEYSEPRDGRKAVSTGCATGAAHNANSIGEVS